ncbi:MAG: hypothetical protein U9R74_20420 [Pseudomonadota bacterium]|nr:hypothetical protein [Pseudomonadota bacterium]
MKIKSSLLSLALVIVIGTASVTASGTVAAQGQYSDGSPSPSAMLVDGVVARPLGLGAMIIGAATWVVTLPFSLIGGNPGEAGRQLVGEPTRFTFRRPLGEFPR